MKIFKWKLPKPYDASVSPEHPDDEPEICQSDRIVKSATPKYTLDWYVKWLATGVIVFSVSARATGIESLHLIDLWGSLVGAALWWWVSFVWRDRALMVVNGVVGFIVIIGLLRYYFG
ncbi:MAG: DUF6552 family protein [Candidatus Thorarchaeota archaeon]